MIMMEPQSMPVIVETKPFTRASEELEVAGREGTEEPRAAGTHDPAKR